MILCIDIGNSNICLGVYDGDKLIWSGRISTERRKTSDEYTAKIYQLLTVSGVDIKKIEGACICNVVPEINSAICTAVKSILKTTPLCVGPGIKTGLNLLVDDPAHLGADLVAAAVGAVSRYELPVLILDLGTATKIIVVDETRAFRGCTIAPGVEISLRALSEKTSQLPNISLEAPTNPIGTNSVSCMQSGVVFGTADMLDGMCRRINRQLKVKAKSIVSTGGLASGIIPYCETDVTDDPNLILWGLKVIYEKNKG